MQFGILGSLLVRVDDAAVEILGGRQRALLAALLLRTRHTVPLDELAEAVWDTASPRTAATLRSYVLRLRRTLGPVAGARLVARPSGYLIDLTDNEVDLLKFTRLWRAGGAALRSGAWAQASELLADALALWRGNPLADIPSDLLLRQHAPRLERQRLQATEWRIDADLRLGRAADVVDELRDLTARHPMQEYGQSQLMLALYRTGRQAEALEVYRQVRARLVEELGVEPSEFLQGLHRRILGADPSLAVETAPGFPRRPAAAGLPEATADVVAVAAPSAAQAVPAQLPADVAAFTGRYRELAELDALLTGPDSPTGDVRRMPVAIAVVTGMAGVGKTALAIQWASGVRHPFPDGKLYVNLHGYDPEQPVTASDALAGFLGALGVPARDIPVDPDERAARYRTETAHRRLLIILDNAASVTQVRPLLPGSAACAVLVTSRDSLAGLVAVDGARRLDLDVLTDTESVLLLRNLIGTRVEAQPEAASALAAQCAWLPLALRVVAELATGRPAAPLSDLTAELGDQQRRLDLLDVDGDPHAAVATVFSWSYRRLPADTARIFRLLGLYPGSSTDRYAAAALADTTVELAGSALDRLTRAHLVQRVAATRYGMHDLLRAYAARLARDEDTTQDTQAALGRLFDYYLGTASIAVDILHPAEADRRPRTAHPSTPVPALVDPISALPWLEAELSTLVAIAARGWPGHTIKLAATLYPYLMGVRYDDAITIYTHAHRAARQLGDVAGEALALLGLGTENSLVGRLDQATGQLRQALTLFRAVDDPHGQARALSNLSIGEGQVGAYGMAFDHIEEALVQFRAAGDGLGQARTLANLSDFAQRLGRHEAAIDYLEQALALFRDGGDKLREARTLTRLVVLGQQLGRYQQCAEHLEYSLALHRALGDREGEAWVINTLGDVEQILGHFDQAAEHHQQSLALARQLHSRNREARALNSLGRLHARRHQPERAVEYYQQALALFRTSGGNQFAEAGALNDLGEATNALRHPVEAIAHHTAALRIATDISSGEHQVRAHLGLGDAHRTLGDHDAARRHYEQAVAVSASSGTTVPDEISAYLASTSTVDKSAPREMAIPWIHGGVRLGRMAQG